MKNVIKKLIIAMIIASLGSLILYHVMFVLSYYVEFFFHKIEMEDGIPVYGLISIVSFIALFVISLIKKNTVTYYFSIGFLSIFISCFSIMISFDGEFSSANGVFVAKANGKYGMMSKWGTEIISSQFERVEVFINPDARYNIDNRVCIFGKGNLFYIATNDGLLFPADRWVTPKFDVEEDAKYMEDYGWIKSSETYGFITCVGDKFNLINFNGEKVLPEDFDKYVKYPSGKYLWVSVNGKWNAYDVTGVKIKKMSNIDFDECMATADGVLLKFGSDVILAQTDKRNMTFVNISEQERINEKNRRNLLLLSMIFSQMNYNNYQYSQMNNLYESYDIYGRSRESIEAEIKKYEKEKAYCESHLNDGIAVGMGYSGIISKYDNMIEDRKQELMMLGH